MRRALVVVCVAGAWMAVAHLACTSFSGEPSEVDAAPTSETGPLLDAMPPAEASMFCASNPGAGLCADFDQGNPVRFHFLEGTGDIDVDEAVFVSAPASMRAIATATTNASVKGQAMGPAFVTTQRLSFQTYQGRPGEDAGVTADSVVSSIVEESTGCAFAIESFGTTPEARLNVTFQGEGGAAQYEDFPLSAYPQAGRWSHVEVLLEDNGDNGVVFVTVIIDKVVALQRRSTQCSALADNPFVSIGLLGTSDRTPMSGQAYFDNALFDSK